MQGDTSIIIRSLRLHFVSAPLPLTPNLFDTFRQVHTYTYITETSLVRKAGAPLFKVLIFAVPTPCIHNVSTRASDGDQFSGLSKISSRRRATFNVYFSPLANRTE